MVNSDYDNVNEKVSWNLSYGIITEISYLLQGASRYYINGNQPKALYYLQCVRMRISANLSEEEIKKMRDTEKEFMKYIAGSVQNGFENSSRQRENYIKVCISYTIYNDLIMSALGKYGYLIPPKEDNTIMM